MLTMNQGGLGADFALSYDSASSRSASPTPSLDDSPRFQFATPQSEKHDIVPGNKAMGVYEATLSKWRAVPRRLLVQIVDRESKILAKMQVKKKPSSLLPLVPTIPT
jgi:hypothetical protein